MLSPFPLYNPVDCKQCGTTNLKELFCVSILDFSLECRFQTTCTNTVALFTNIHWNQLFTPVIYKIFSCSKSWHQWKQNIKCSPKEHLKGFYCVSNAAFCDLKMDVSLWSDFSVITWLKKKKHETALDTAGLRGTLPSPADPSHTPIFTWCPKLARLPWFVWFQSEQEQFQTSAAVGKLGSDLCDASPAFHASCCSVAVALIPPPHTHTHRSSQLLSLRPGFKCLFFTHFGCVYFRLSRAQMTLNVRLINKSKPPEPFGPSSALL